MKTHGEGDEVDDVKRQKIDNQSCSESEPHLADVVTLVKYKKKAFDKMYATHRLVFKTHMTYDKYCTRRQYTRQL